VDLLELLSFTELDFFLGNTSSKIQFMSQNRLHNSFMQIAANYVASKVIATFFDVLVLLDNCAVMCNISAQSKNIENSENIIILSESIFQVYQTCTVRVYIISNNLYWVKCKYMDNTAEEYTVYQNKANTGRVL